MSLFRFADIAQDGGVKSENIRLLLKHHEDAKEGKSLFLIFIVFFVLFLMCWSSVMFCRESDVRHYQLFSIWF